MDDTTPAGLVRSPIEVPLIEQRAAGQGSPARTRHAAPALDASDVFMLGIGGCGMSGLARIIRSHGVRVGGADATLSHVTSALEQQGFHVESDSPALRLPGVCDLLVVSAAIKPSHPLVLEAERRGIPVLTYAEALGALTRRHTAVALAGTHGKSTTSAMLGACLVDCGLDPSVIVGATCSQLEHGAIGAPMFAGPSGYRVGARTVPLGPYEDREGILVAEACEFNRSFHNLSPTIASISAVEADHLDIYGSLDAVVESFATFARLLPHASEGGKLLIAHDGAHRREVTAGVRAAVETIGFSPAADWRVAYDPTSREVTLSKGRELSCTWALRMPGEHNAINSATAVALAIMLGADPASAARSLAAFKGLDRRCQLLGARRLEGGGVRVYDDYGHHPTEIDATLRALREFERPQDRGGRLVCVFQPHQHSRTRFFLEEFASSFASADVVIVPHIYFVRDSEAERQKVSSKDLVDRLRQRDVRAMHLYPFEAIIEQLENVCRPNDLLVVMGAGPVWKVARGYLDAGLHTQAAADPTAGDAA